MFPPRGDISINYDYFDIADGTGYVVYKAFRAQGELVFTSNDVYSEIRHTNSMASISVSKSTFTTIKEVDIDLNFEVPKNIKGELILVIPLGISRESGTTKDFFFKVTGTIYHYDGSTETQLATGDSTQYYAQSVGNDVPQSETSIMKFDLASKHFKAGETLRVNLILKAKTDESSANTCWGGFGHDPLGSTDKDFRIAAGGAIFSAFDPQTITGVDTKLEAHVPFKIDLTT